jgi:hypothetical protein
LAQGLSHKTRRPNLFRRPAVQGLAERIRGTHPEATFDVNHSHRLSSTFSDWGPPVLGIFGRRIGVNWDASAANTIFPARVLISALSVYG